MDFKDRLKIARARSQFSQEELARMIDVRSATISRWELGKRIPRSDDVMKLASALGVSVDYLLSGGENDNSEFGIRNSELKTKDKDEKPAGGGAARPADLPPSNVRPALHHTMVPLVSSEVKVCCGAGNIYPDTVEWDIVGAFPVETRTLIEYGWQAGEGGFHVIDVEGDSMSPQIKDGNRVLFADTRQKISNGDVYVVRYNDRLLIRYILTTGGGIKLVAANKEYEPIEVSFENGDDFCVVGKVLEVYTLRRVRNFWG